MCEQCLVNPLYFGEVIPGWCLIRARRQGSDMEVGDWGLLRMNDPDLIWKSTPQLDPTFYMTDDEEAEYWKTHSYKDEAVHAAEDFVDTLWCQPVSLGYDLVSAMMEAGYSRKQHGPVEWWLWQKLAEHIRDTEPTVDEVDPLPGSDDHMPHNYEIGKE
jgi:hypothetical protein